MTPVYVPSKGRAGRSATLRALAEEGRQNVHVVVPPGEVVDYAEATGHPGWHVTRQVGRGIWDARQTILMDARSRGVERFWMVDDDTTGTFRQTTNGFHRMPMSEAMEEMEARITNPDVKMFGPNFRHRAWQGLSDETDVHLRNFICIRSDAPANYWDNVKEDLDFLLQVLTQGYHTIRFNEYAFDSPHMGTTEGGCWDDYLAGATDVASHALAAKWPGLVKVDLNMKAGYVTNRTSWAKVREEGRRARYLRGQQTS